MIDMNDMNTVTEARDDFIGRTLRRIEAEEIAHRILDARHYLDWNSDKRIVVVMSPDVHCILQHGIVLKAEKEGQKTISKIFGCDVKIVYGKGILLVGYDALGGESDA